MFADLLSLGCDIDFTPSDVANHRKMLAWSILNDKMTSFKKEEKDLRSTQSQDRQQRCNPANPANPATTFEHCMRFQVVGRTREHFFAAEDNQIPTSQLSSIARWEVVSNKATSDRNKAMKKSGCCVEV